MPVVLRMARAGTKKRPVYHIVAADSRSPRDGRFIERLGYFKEEGLEVEISDLQGGSKTMQALLGGSIDIASGAYEHTVRMQAKGQDIRAVLELGRFPAIAVGVKKGRKWESPADFRGMKVGVTAPGSSTNMLMNFVLAMNASNKSITILN